MTDILIHMWTRCTCFCELASETIDFLIQVIDLGGVSSVRGRHLQSQISKVFVKRNQILAHNINLGINAVLLQMDIR